MKLSLEATEETHDSIRGKGSFQKTMKTYAALGQLIEKYPNFELGINTVFCSVNQDHMDDLIGFVNGLDKIKTHTVSLIRGSVADERLKEVDIEKYLETVNKLDLNLKKRISGIYRFQGARLKAAQDILQRRMIYEIAVNNKQQVSCYAGRLNLVITESGDVYPCESFSMGIGNVRDSGYDIKRILEGSKAKKVLKAIYEEGCFCTHECYLMTNILFNPRVYPSLFKEYLQLLFSSS